MHQNLYNPTQIRNTKEKKYQARVPLAKHLHVEPPQVSQPLPCKNHIYTYKTNHIDYIFHHSQTKPPSWNAIIYFAQYLWISFDHRNKCNKKFYILMNTTHLQKFSLLAPVPWDRNSISIRFKKYQKLWIGWCSIPNLQNHGRQSFKPQGHN